MVMPMIFAKYHTESDQRQLWSRKALCGEISSSTSARDGAHARPIKTTDDYYERVSEDWNRRFATPVSNNRPEVTSHASYQLPRLGPLLKEKSAAALMGGFTGAIAGGGMGLVGTLIHTGRLTGAATPAKQGAVFMGTIFALGNLFRA
mmetsp:Transcript_41159/g.74369  ORF Transcript_41159/g.74369 Transcript_41159/m.74369 type:complete len:148 (-) Transcript_41159:29-472(-)